MTSSPLTFARLVPQKPDALLALIAQFRADPRPDKIDVGVGVYRDESGATPIMSAVKAAEARLLAEQPSKSYLGAEGDLRFAELLAGLVFDDAALNDGRFGLQTPGGTGALRLGAELLARTASEARVWLSHPTWPNHAPIFTEAGLQVRTHPYFSPQTGGIDFSAMLAALAEARQGDILLLHGCCHNPTGTQFSGEEWRALSQLCIARGLIPFIDLAYQGLGDGLHQDSEGARHMLEAVPAALLAYSCDKNFALYRDRVGALFVQGESASVMDLARTNALVLARSLWSMPPDHGAAVVRTILDNPALRADWREELADMRLRLNAVRDSLASAHPLLAPIATQRGLFSLLPIQPEAVAVMRQRHGIYMPADGRINLAGLNRANLARFVDGLLPHLGAAEASRLMPTTSVAGVSA